ncbi:argininosuccinate lyase [Enterococcus hirae]|nr:argininosuccinate lyase [Enterococcus hirae]
MEKLWGGRFEEKPEAWVDKFGASIPFDKELAKEDIEGSLAHVKMLGKTGIIAPEEAEKIAAGLKKVAEKLADGEMTFDIANEDVHMNTEKHLFEEIGDVAGKLHTARSRNDQVATDLHLYMKKAIQQTVAALKELRVTLVHLADENVETIMPGYTHLQHAQPISFAHHMLAYYEMFTRDEARFTEAYKRTDRSPLGSAALAGTTFPIDRSFVSKQLGFAAPYDNSMDAVSDRDFVLEYLSAAAITMMHLSRLAEEIIFWSSHEFKFIELSDGFSTGSSIMPQKKNPDMAELIRGKTGRVYGDLMGLLTTMKGLPLAYNKDLQEDKEGVFDAYKTVKSCLKIMSGMLRTMHINRAHMEESTKKDFSNATELADYLAAKDVPFRKAHEIVGKLVLDCTKKGIYLQDVPLAEYQKISPLIESDIYEALKSRVAVARRNSYGGTGFDQVRYQVEKAKEDLGMDA